MPGVKAPGLLLMTLLVSACSSITKDPWGWLDEPAEQAWKPVVIHAIGRDIEFSVPDRLEGRGNHTEYWPESGATENGFEFQLESERVYLPATFMARFWWDGWWGGFYKKGGTDFYLSVSIWYLEGDSDFLDLTFDQQVDWLYEYWLSRFSKSASDNDRFLERFIREFSATPFVTESGLEFVRHNAPQFRSGNQEFAIPLSDNHILEFNFHVNKLRFNFKEDPAWNQSRWEMVEKIMKTVRITPDPFGGQPEDVPAQ